MSSALVQRWIDWSGTVTREEFSAIPLIDTWPGLDLDLEEELHRAWRDGDSELHPGFVGALLESPMDFAVRFAALNAYDHLMEHKRSEEEVDVLDRLAKQREAFRKKLAFFVGFQSVESCGDLRTATPGGQTGRRLSRSPRAISSRHRQPAQGDMPSGGRGYNA